MINVTIDFFKHYNTEYGYSEIYVVHKDSDQVPLVFEKRYTKSGYEYFYREYWLTSREDYNLNQLLTSWFDDVYLNEDDDWNHF